MAVHGYCQSLTSKNIRSRACVARTLGRSNPLAPGATGARVEEALRRGFRGSKCRGKGRPDGFTGTNSSEEFVVKALRHLVVELLDTFDAARRLRRRLRLGVDLLDVGNLRGLGVVARGLGRLVQGLDVDHAHAEDQAGVVVAVGVGGVVDRHRVVADYLQQRRACVSHCLGGA